MNVAKTSVVVSIIMTIGYFISFIKEAVVANFFGVSSEVDAYTIAIQIPVNLFAIVAVAVRSVVIPVYSELLHREGSEKGADFLNNFITMVALVAISMILLCEIFASGIIYIFAPGFSPETHIIATQLLRLTLPTMLFTVVGQIFIALLNVHKNFIWPAFSVYLLSGTVIILTLLLHARLGIASACLGQVIGSFFYMSYLLLIGRNTYRYRIRFQPHDKQIQRSLKMSVPIIWSIGVAEINTIINRAVASFLFAGSIAALGYASKINTVFMSFFISAISMIVYPLYAESSAKDDMSGLSQRVNSTLSAYAMLLLPLMCVLMIFRTEVIEVAFARGRFDAEAVQQTQVLFGCYVLGIIFSAFRETLTKVFYAMKDTKTPAKNATIGVLLNIVLNLTLPWLIGVKGLAIATSISAMYISVSLLIIMKRRYNSMSLKSFFHNLTGIAISTVVMTAVVMVFVFAETGLSSLSRLIVGSIAAAGAYILALSVIRVPIWRTLLPMLIKRKK